MVQHVGLDIPLYFPFEIADACAAFCTKYRPAIGQELRPILPVDTIFLPSGYVYLQVETLCVGQKALADLPLLDRVIPVKARQLASPIANVETTRLVSGYGPEAQFFRDKSGQRVLEAN